MPSHVANCIVVPSQVDVAVLHPRRWLRQFVCEFAQLRRSLAALSSQSLQGKALRFASQLFWLKLLELDVCYTLIHASVHYSTPHVRKPAFADVHFC